MSQFELHCTTSDTVLRFSGEVPRGADADGWFLVSLEGGELSASVRVYDIHPHHWSLFFEQLAEHWRGWPGERSHESLEHHLRLSASTDSLGHISLRLLLRGIDSGSNWRAEETLFLEAGQLERVAKAARRFFG
jgi:hypothetical protein